MSQNISSKPESQLKSASGISLQSNTIDGAFSLGANETQKITIEGVEYTIKNRADYRNDLSYIKDTTTGELTFIASNFEIRGQEDVAHNIVISGRYNIVYGGSLDDTISDMDSTTCGENRIYGGDGADTITLRTSDDRAFGNGGNDILIGYAGSFDGGDGDDTFNMYNGSAIGGVGNDTFNMYGGVAYGSEGNDIFNLYKAGTFNGDDGDDTFNILASFSGATINGGVGTNTVTGNVGNNTTINVIGANTGSVSLVKGVEQEVNVNGKTYILSTNSAKAEVMYKESDSGQISFSIISGTAIIKGDPNQKHNVFIADIYQTFYGGNQGDTIKMYSVTNVYCGSGDNTIISGGYGVKIYCQDGNNTITCADTSYIYGGSGNNNVTLKNDGNYLESGTGIMNLTLKGSNNIIYGKNGNNTLVSNTGQNNFIIGFGDGDNAQGIALSKGETKTVTINGVNYTIKNRSSTDSRALLYTVNPITGAVSFSGVGITITGQKNVVHDVKLCGSGLNFYGGDLNDNIEMLGGNHNVYGMGGNDLIIANKGGNIYGGDGDDTIIANEAATIYGEAGNDTITINKHGAKVNGGDGDDTYNINATANLTDNGGNNIYNINTSGVNITSGSGADTFYINGDNNIINGSGGNDYFIIMGNNNNLVGGTGTNYYIDSGQNNSYVNVFVDPSATTLYFSYQGEVQTFTIGGKTYKVTNNFAGANTFNYSINMNTKIVGIIGSNFTVESLEDQAANMEVRGDNNTIIGSNLSDKITISSGSNNTVDAKDGNDILTMNTSNNSINGGEGNDTITLNASTNQSVTGGNGADIININSGNNTNINSGGGNDTINVDGENNIVDAGEGNNKIFINEDLNIIKLGNGDNKITVLSSKNTVTAGSGNNILGIEGNENNLNVQNAYGDINIYGNKNVVFNTRGENKVNIKGDENNYSTTIGGKDISVNGSGNEILTGVQDDTINVVGSNNIIETTGGDNVISIKGNSNQIQGGFGADNIKINGNDNQAKGGDLNDNFIVSSGRNNIIDGETGNRNTLIDNGINTISSNVVDITPRPFEVNIKVGIGSGADKYISTSISFNLFDFSVDFSDVKSSMDSLESIDSLLKNVTDQLLNIGSTINRLESAAEAQSISLENMISSLSTIRDADIAEVSSDFIRSQILQNATITLLDVTRNIREENILSLINNVNVR